MRVVLVLPYRVFGYARDFGRSGRLGESSARDACDDLQGPSQPIKPACAAIIVKIVLGYL